MLVILHSSEVCLWKIEDGLLLKFLLFSSSFLSNACIAEKFLSMKVFPYKTQRHTKFPLCKIAHSFRNAINRNVGRLLAIEAFSLTYSEGQFPMMSENLFSRSVM